MVPGKCSREKSIPGSAGGNILMNIILGKSFSCLFDIGEDTTRGLVIGVFIKTISQMRDSQLRSACAIKDEAEVIASGNGIRRQLDGECEVVFRLREKIGVYANSAKRVESIDVFGVKLQYPLINRRGGLQTAGAGEAKKCKQFEDFWIVAVYVHEGLDVTWPLFIKSPHLLVTNIVREDDIGLVESACQRKAIGLGTKLKGFVQLFCVFFGAGVGQAGPDVLHRLDKVGITKGGTLGVPRHILRKGEVVGIDRTITCPSPQCFLCAKEGIEKAGGGMQAVGLEVTADGFGV